MPLMNDEFYRQSKFKGKVCSPLTRRSGNSKDTKLWCKGKIGREHVKEWRTSNKHNHRVKWMELLCVNCEKRFDYCCEWLAGRGEVCKCGFHVKASSAIY